MNVLKLSLLMLVGMIAAAAQDARIPRVGPAGVVQQSAAKPSTNNYQLEFEISRSGRNAKYMLGFSGGQVSTDLIDRASERLEGVEPRMISFQATFTPFEDENGAEGQFFIGRSLLWKSTQQQPSPGQPNSSVSREIVSSRQVGLTTKAALFFGKPVVLFDDGEEKISVKLTKAEQN